MRRKIFYVNKDETYNIFHKKIQYKITKKIKPENEINDQNENEKIVFRCETKPDSELIKLKDMKIQSEVYSNIRCEIKIYYFPNVGKCVEHIKKNFPHQIDPSQISKLSIIDKYHKFDKNKNIIFREEDFKFDFDHVESDTSIFIYEYSGEMFVMKEENPYLLSVKNIFKSLEGKRIKEIEYTLFYFFMKDVVSKVNENILVEVWGGENLNSEENEEIEKISDLIGENCVELIHINEFESIFYFQDYSKDSNTDNEIFLKVHNNIYDMYIKKDNIEKVISEECEYLGDFLKNLSFELTDEEQPSNWFQNAYSINQIYEMKEINEGNEISEVNEINEKNDEDEDDYKSDTFDEDDYKSDTFDEDDYKSDTFDEDDYKSDTFDEESEDENIEENETSLGKRKRDEKDDTLEIPNNKEQKVPINLE